MARDPLGVISEVELTAQVVVGVPGERGLEPHGWPTAVPPSLRTHT